MQIDSMIAELIYEDFVPFVMQLNHSKKMNSSIASLHLKRYLLLKKSTV